MAGKVYCKSKGLLSMSSSQRATNFNTAHMSTILNLNAMFRYKTYYTYA